MPKIVCKIHVLIKAVWAEKPTQKSFVDYKQIKWQMFLQFLFQDLHHLLSVSMTLTVISSDRQHCRLSIMQMTARMDKWLWTPLAGSCSTHRQFWNSGVIAVKQKSDREALGKFKGLAVRYLQAPDEWCQCGGHTASARCTWESSNDLTFSTFYWNVDAVHGAMVLGPAVDGDPEYTP